jgi:hypothetical protein
MTLVRRRSSPNKYNADSVERLVALTDEHADFSREFSSSFPLRGLAHSGETSGQLLFDGVVRRVESAQSQFGSDRPSLFHWLDPCEQASS